MSRNVFGKEVFTTLEEMVVPEHTALMIVDPQNDFCSPGGCFDRLPDADMSLVKPFIENTARLLSAARQAKVMVIFTKATNYPGGIYKSAPDLARKIEYLDPDAPLICAYGQWGDEIIDGLKPLPGEIVISKNRHSSFAGTHLDMLLRSNGIKTVIVTGIATERCVLATIAGAIAHDYYVVVPRDCVASAKLNIHNAALLVMSANLMKDEFTTSERIIKAWQTYKSGNRATKTSA
ncbi:MAG: isochorismatase family cysteine hydrolase [Dehalococcoidia bacterium]|nr:isochorismatase family cysteine hydrolase [Dehalococcoidia bacterium]